MCGARLRRCRTLEVSKLAELPSSQEGSTIETAVEIVRGVVPEPHSLRMHSETSRLGNHPSRHRKERDDAALLTQEGNLGFWTAVVNDRPFRTISRVRQLSGAAELSYTARNSEEHNAISHWVNIRKDWISSFTN